MIDYNLHIVISTHNFCVTRITPKVRPVILQFIKDNLLQYGLVRVQGGKYVNSAVKVYCASSVTREQFRFHINIYEKFLEYLKIFQVTENLMSITVKPLVITDTISLPVQSKWVAFEEQIPAIEYLADNNSPYRSRILELQTGKGKSLSAMLGMSLFSKRVAIIVKSMYIEKWVADILKTYEIKESEIMVVSGSENLKGLIQMGKLGILKSKFIVISNKTIQNWYKLYEIEGKEILEMGYDCLPEDFFETICCGTRLIDEVHQDFHLNFKIDLYTNIERSISLSATMVNYDSFMEKMYRLAYPTVTRFEGPPLDKYVIARELSYHIRDDRKYNVTEYNSHIYSHHALERSILKVKDFADNYCKLIWNTIEIGFMHNYVKGQRCLVFCSGIDMCTRVSEYLQTRYPNFSVKRYVQDDPYENLLESDISVSTLLSAGTAHDIANLKTVILTVAINSLQSNVQSLGRLRKLKDANTYFIYFVCQDIPKHIAYATDKEKMLKERAANFIQINAPFLV